MTFPIMTSPTAVSSSVLVSSQPAKKRFSEHQRARQGGAIQSSHKEAARYQPSKLFSFKRHEHLDERSQGLWRIQSGYVRSLTWDCEGELVPLGFWQTGDVVGGAIAQTSPYKSQCLTAVTAEHLGHTYAFSRNMLLLQIRQSNELLQISHCNSAEQRLLSFICWITKRFGQCVARGDYVSQLRLTHQEIAESIGITRVTVTRLLKALERESCIKWGTREKIVYKSAFKR